MTAVEKIDEEIARLDAILARRGQFYEDEAAMRRAYGYAAQWLREEKAVRDKIEIEALEAAEAPEPAIQGTGAQKFKARRV